MPYYIIETNSSDEAEIDGIAMRAGSTEKDGSAFTYPENSDYLQSYQGFLFASTLTSQGNMIIRSKKKAYYQYKGIIDTVLEGGYETFVKSGNISMSVDGDVDIKATSKIKIESEKENISLTTKDGKTAYIQKNYFEDSWVKIEHIRKTQNIKSRGYFLDFCWSRKLSFYLAGRYSSRIFSIIVAPSSTKVRGIEVLAASTGLTISCGADIIVTQQHDHYLVGEARREVSTVMTGVSKNSIGYYRNNIAPLMFPAAIWRLRRNAGFNVKFGIKRMLPG